MELIRDLYFPQLILRKDMLPEFVYWEWGMDKNGIPHVFDWA